MRNSGEILESEDGVVQFFEDDHIYEVKKTKQKLTSVSNLIKKYTNEFDADGSILRKSAAKAGVSPEELRKEWDKKRDDSAQRGSDLHLQLEKLIKTGEVEDTPDKDIIQQFKDLNLQGQIKSEVILYDLDFEIAGQSDIVEEFHNLLIFNVLDLKSNKAISTFSYGKRMLPPLQEYWDSTFNKYVFQLNTYSYMHEKATGYWPNEMKLLWINPKRKLIPMEIPNVRADVVKMLNHYKKTYLDK